MLQTKSSYLLIMMMSLGTNISYAQKLTSPPPVTLIAPSSFHFKIVNDSPNLKCQKLMQWLADYTQKDCIREYEDSDECDSLSQRIRINSRIPEKVNEIEYTRVYSLESDESINNAPEHYSKRIDIAYTEAAYLSPNTAMIDLAGKNGSRDLEIIQKLKLDAKIKISSESRNLPTLTIQNGVVACALEKGSILLKGTATVRLSTYHPLGNLRYDLVESAYDKAKTLNQTPYSLAKKQFLLGVNVGQNLKAAGKIADPIELEDAAQSVVNVMMSEPDTSTVLRKDFQNGRQAAFDLLEASKTIQSAAIEITAFQSESQ